MPWQGNTSMPEPVFVAPSSKKAISPRPTTTSAGCGRWSPTTRALNSATAKP
jgi:hypothetical protein